MEPQRDLLRSHPIYHWSSHSREYTSSFSSTLPKTAAETGLRISQNLLHSTPASKQCEHLPQRGPKPQSHISSWLMHRLHLPQHRVRCSISFWTDIVRPQNLQVLSAKAPALGVDVDFSLALQTARSSSCPVVSTDTYIQDA
jgi:hypothetical protein